MVKTTFYLLNIYSCLGWSSSLLFILCVLFYLRNCIYCVCGLDLFRICIYSKGGLDKFHVYTPMVGFLSVCIYSVVWIRIECKNSSCSVLTIHGNVAKNIYPTFPP